MPDQCRRAARPSLRAWCRGPIRDAVRLSGCYLVRQPRHPQPGEGGVRRRSLPTGRSSNGCAPHVLADGETKAFRSALQRFVLLLREPDVHGAVTWVLRLRPSGTHHDDNPRAGQPTRLSATQEVMCDDTVQSAASSAPEAAPTSERVPVTALRAGDWVTEPNDLHGPWYEVIQVTANAVTIDGRLSHEDPPLPVTVGYNETSMVRRRTTC